MVFISDPDLALNSEHCPVMIFPFLSVFYCHMLCFGLYFPMPPTIQPRKGKGPKGETNDLEVQDEQGHTTTHSPSPGRKGSLRAGKEVKMGVEPMRTFLLSRSWRPDFPPD